MNFTTVASLLSLLNAANGCVQQRKLLSKGRHPFGHVAITHQPLTALEQWKASRHAAVSGCGQWQRWQTGASPQ